MDIPAGHLVLHDRSRRSVVEDVGVMDPVFGRGYCEETDWSLRSLAAGYRVALAPGTFVYHAGRGSNLERRAGRRASTPRCPRTRPSSTCATRASAARCGRSRRPAAPSQARLHGVGGVHAPRRRRSRLHHRRRLAAARRATDEERRALHRRARRPRRLGLDGRTSGFRARPRRHRRVPTVASRSPTASAAGRRPRSTCATGARVADALRSTFAASQRNGNYPSRV